MVAVPHSQFIGEDKMVCTHKAFKTWPGTNLNTQINISVMLIVSALNQNHI